MPCDGSLKQGQTMSQRMQEVREATARIDGLIARGRVDVRVDKRRGTVVFVGISDEDRDGLTDGCILRRIRASGSAQARRAIQEAESAAGRSIDRRTVAQGVHSHDGGRTWHPRG